MSHRTYLTTTKTRLATAYGFASEQTIVSRIRKNLHRLEDEQLRQLGEWTGNSALMPDQTQIIVELLGTPHAPEMLYTVK